MKLLLHAQSVCWYCTEVVREERTGKHWRLLFWVLIWCGQKQMGGGVVAVYMPKAPCIQLQGSQGASTQLIAPYLDVREDTSHQ